MVEDSTKIDYEEWDFREEPSRKLPECDLVMKGGITSGVVYPPAILELAMKYRFRSIGGSSAGAIAAALAAAAEHGRNAQGFNGLARSQKWVSQGKNLRNLFQASSETRPLLETVLALMAKKPQGKLRAAVSLYSVLIHKDWKAVFAGSVVGLLITELLSLFFVIPALLAGGSPSDWNIYTPMLLFGMIGVGLGGISGGIYHLYRILVKKLPEEHFWGICKGRPVNHNVEALTDWLSKQLDDLAGIGQPLTFGDLDRRNITLKLVATNLCHGEPYVFPRDSKTASHEEEWEYIFNEKEMKELFPDYVVDYMVSRSEEDRSSKNNRLAKGYYWLPRGNQLPVIVATRMSLSFPILLSAVPLYQIRDFDKYDVKGAAAPLDACDMNKSWFSDGGICSNFPIHFFDAWLSTRPTFGINLTSMPDYMPPEDRSSDKPEKPQQEQVFLPRANERGNLQPEWSALKGLHGFAMAIFHSAQNYRDNMQSRLPSYFERIVQIRLKEKEGGLNLDMDPEIIEAIDKIGRRAGETLRNEFNFDHHRWVRLRVLMEQLESQLNNIEPALQPQDISDLLQAQRERTRAFPYRLESNKKANKAAERIAELREFIENWTPPTNADGQTPASYYFFPPVSARDPQPELRVSPRL